MNQTLFTLLLVLPLVSNATSIMRCSIPPELANAEQLDKAYSDSSLVFLARVTVSGPNDYETIHYELVQPALKGELQARGKLIASKYPCLGPVTSSFNGSLFVFFLDSKFDPVMNNSAVLADIPTFGGQTWVVDWLTKMTSHKPLETDAKRSPKSTLQCDVAVEILYANHATVFQTAGAYLDACGGLYEYEPIYGDEFFLFDPATNPGVDHGYMYKATVSDRVARKRRLIRTLSEAEMDEVGNGALRATGKLENMGTHRDGGRTVLVSYQATQAEDFFLAQILQEEGVVIRINSNPEVRKLFGMLERAMSE